MNFRPEQKSPSLTRFLGITFLFAVVFMVGTILITDHVTRGRLEKLIADELTAELSARKTHLESFLDYRHKEITFLHSTPPVSGIARAMNNGGIDPRDNTRIDHWFMRLQTIFKAYLDTHPEVNQARYIGLANNGTEIVRVERNDDNIEIREPDALQSKQGEPYFAQILQLSANEIYVSDITLNREHGKIVYPWWPTLRVAEPVFDDQNGFFGFIILNYDANELLQTLNNDGKEYVNVYLRNSTGGFLLHPNSELAFKFEFEPDAEKAPLFHVINEQKLTHLFQKGSDPKTGENYFFKQIRLTLSEREGRFLDLSVAIPENHLDEALADSRSFVFSILASLLIAGILLLAFYQNQINKKIRILHNEAEFKAIFQSSSDAIVSTNEQGQIWNWNSGAERIFGFTASEAKNRSVFGLFSSSYPTTLTPELLHDVFHKQQTLAVDAQAVTQQNKSTDVAVTLSPIKLENSGATVGIAMIVRDISEQKAINNQIRNLNESLEKRVQQRTEELEQARNEAMLASKSKSEFIANISHEIRTPMNGVISSLRLLRSESLNTKQQHFVSMAVTSANTLTTLINDVLDISKIEAGKLDLENIEFNILQLLSEVAAAMGLVSQEKGLEFILDLHEVRHEWAYGDPTRIRQILFNLIGNANKFTDKGEIHLIASTNANQNREIILSCSVVDTGIGITEQKLGSLFEAFNQEDSSISRRFGGTGLGLRICKQLSALMGGKIEVESKKDLGSAFSFSLSLAPGDDSQPISFQTKPAIKCVLVVSNNSRLISAISNQLSTWAIDARGAPNAAHARQLCESAGKEAQGKFDLILIDHLLDNIPGQTLGEELGKRFDYATDDLVIMRPAQNSSATNSLAKPVLPGELWRFVTNGQAESDIQIKDPGLPGANDRLYFGGKILLVDDNFINLEVATAMLTGYGVEIIQADSGEAALESLRIHKDVDLVFMDCQMPGMDGYTATRAIRKGIAGATVKHLPIVAMTANAMGGAREQCMEAGMNDYLTKPVDPALLEEKLARFLKADVRKMHSNDDHPAATNAHADTSALTKPAETQTAPAQVEKSGNKTSEIWDIESALRRMSGKPERLRKITGMFVDNFPQYNRDLLQTFTLLLGDDAMFSGKEARKEQYTRLRSAAHKIKGTAGNLSAMQVYEICGTIEEAANRDAPARELQSLYENYNKAVIALMPVLLAYLDTDQT